MPPGDISRMNPFMNQYTAAIQKDGELWIGWIEEVPDVNTQGNSREELLENLHSALTEALEMNREEADQQRSLGVRTSTILFPAFQSSHSRA
jgi:predicted RNase H-like HicB family nuclease